jgi:hypothetical protein
LGKPLIGHEKIALNQMSNEPNGSIGRARGGIKTLADNGTAMELCRL